MDEPSAPATFHVYKRRFWMLGLFSSTSFLNALFGSLYVSTADVTACYYGVGQDAVNWTTACFMLVYLLLFLPVTKLFAVLGLRWIIILGSGCNCAACGLLFAALKPDDFAFALTSQVFASCSNILILGVPPFLATRWFPSDQVSRASAVGVLGNMLGLGAGYVLPTILISGDCLHKDSIEREKLRLAIIYGSANLVVFILTVLTFQNSPPSPPSEAEEQKEVVDDSSNTKVVLRMLRNKDFLLVLVMYGISGGCFFALSTSFNDLIHHFFEHRNMEIGWMGFLLIACGLAGSVIAGYLLDITHRFKEISLTILIMSAICHALFSGLLYLKIFWIQFVTISFYGFFLASFFSVGFEYGVEVTYPDSEYVCASLMNTSMNIFGIILIEGVTHLLDDVGPIASNSAIAVSLVLCCVVTSFISKNYKRSKTQVNDNMT